ncbi:hypothetical protein SynMITS9220_00179 [Synechococcus sp. MIT S9220]|nr:hypothetical protein SynMITS9220_00179 [Synechococcus sp. MIT S9220]
MLLDISTNIEKNGNCSNGSFYENSDRKIKKPDTFANE